MQRCLYLSAVNLKEALRAACSRPAGCKGKYQLACKPGSVRPERTPAWRPFFWDGHCCPPLATYPDGAPETEPDRKRSCAIPIRSCSRWGLPCHACYQPCGGLLPHPFTLAPPVFAPVYGEKGRRGGLFSVALSLGLPPPDVIRHRISMEPGLSSPAAFRHWSGAAARPAGRGDVCAINRRCNEKYRSCADQRSSKRPALLSG
jgi:hypothetical protein